MSASSSETSQVWAPAFSGVALDRAEKLRRDPVWIAQQLAQSSARVVAATREGVLLNDSPQPLLLRRAVESETRRAIEQSSPILLGLDDGAPIFAADLEELEPAVRARFSDGARISTLRDAGAMLSRSEGGLAAYLMALLNWHRMHRFCANCGAATCITQAGYARRCPRCSVVHFPRTDPVVIMLVHNGERLLLGRRAGWPEDRYSVLAGFVSPGESLEEAVEREVLEESGIRAYDPRFVTSQPWPFPSSLMLGFEARSDGGEPRARDGELEDVQWFTLDEVRAAMMQPSSPLQLPPPISIARLLIERWVAGKR